MPISRTEFQTYWKWHHSPIANAERAARSAFADERQLGNRERPALSQTVWKQAESNREYIFKRIRFGIARGEDALSIAEDLEKWLDPAFLPTRLENGKIIDDGRRSVLTETPGRVGVKAEGGYIPQRGSYAARRIARTETSAAHGAATLKAVEKADGSIKWALSGSHPEEDDCDEKASGGAKGDGVYPPQNCPAYPSHPHCLCVLRPQINFEGMGARLRKQYGLDEPLITDFE